MRRLSFDRDEFDPPDSEQSLDLVISSPTRHADLSLFLAECGASAVDGQPPCPGWPRWHEVAELLRRFAGLELPHPSKCHAILLIRDEWNDLEMAITVGTVVIWYHWLTTA